MIEHKKPGDLQETGKNLIKIAKALLDNQNLLRYLWYPTLDPLNQDLEDITFQQAYGNGGDGIVRIIPIINPKTTPTSIIVIRVPGGSLSTNSSFMNIPIKIDVCVPISNWVTNSENLRPFDIMHEILKTLNGMSVNGLGKLTGSSFDLTLLTHDLSIYTMDFEIVQYK